MNGKLVCIRSLTRMAWSTAMPEPWTRSRFGRMPVATMTRSASTVFPSARATRLRLPAAALSRTVVPRCRVPAVLKGRLLRLRVDARDALADDALDLEGVVVGLVGGEDLLLRDLPGEVVRQDHARVGRLVADEGNGGGAAVEVADGLDGVDR